MFAYTDWANDKLVAILEKMDDADLNRKLNENSASLRDRLAHIVGAEAIWLLRWKGETPTAPPEWAPSANVPTLIGKMKENRAERDRLMEQVTEADLPKIGTYRNLKGDVVWQIPVGQMLMHVANHATHHRGQIAMGLRQMGSTPPQMDFLFFAVDRSKPA